LSPDKSGSATILSDLAVSVFFHPGYRSVLGAVWIDLFRVPELYVFLPGPIEHKKKKFPILSDLALIASHVISISKTAQAIHVYSYRAAD
jgi:hypothetical protein